MINNFPAKSFYNPGGLRKFKFIPAYQVTGYPDIQSGIITQTVPLISGGVWFEGYSTPETLSFDEEGTPSENGPIYNQEIIGFAPGNKPELHNLMSEMQGDVPFVVQITDNSGQIRLVGSHGSLLTFTAKYVTGPNRAAARGYQFKFSAQSIFSAPAYNA